MKENYYDILEINKNASEEIIEKAYKTLVKKYHPDLQDDTLKDAYEKKIKKINEAYDVLSNPEKRKSYDLELESYNQNNQINSQDYNNLYNENIKLQNEINYLKHNQNNNHNENTRQYNTNNANINHQNYSNQEINNSTANYIKDVLNEKINNAVNKAYHDAYIEDLKNRGYKIRYKKTGKDILAFLLTIAFLALIGFILWQIPPIRNYFINLYNDNDILKGLINIIFNK